MPDSGTQLTAHSKTPTTRQRLPLRALTALATAAFITVLTETLPAGVLPAMGADLHVSAATMGQSVTIYAIGTAVAAIPVATATARWRRKRLLLTGVAGFAVANTVTALSVWFPLTMVARFAAGVAAGVVWALLAGYARRMAPVALQGKAMAIAMTGIPLALSLGVPAGTFLGAAFSWRVTFGVMTGLAVILIGWIVLLVPDYPGTRAGGRIPVLATVRIPGVAAVLAVTTGFVLANTILYTYIATFLGRLGMGGSTGLVLLVYGVASMISIGVVGAYIDRRLRMLTATAAILFAVAAAVLALLSGSHPLVYLAVALWGCGWGGVPTLLQTAVADAGGAGAENAQALLVTLWNGSMAVGGAVGGVLLDAFGPASFPWSSLALLVPVLFLVFLARTHAFPAVRGAVGRGPSERTSRDVAGMPD